MELQSLNAQINGHHLPRIAAVVTGNERENCKMLRIKKDQKSEEVKPSDKKTNTSIEEEGSIATQKGK